mmetsp:Transcript_74809/g.173315  ORF Transcript_74809/g.173315 Transcript_74809/m.173315 type:complete len:118 (+) Transcript_74809:38-391(+)
MAAAGECFAAQMREPTDTEESESDLEWWTPQSLLLGAASPTSSLLLGAVSTAPGTPEESDGECNWTAVPFEGAFGNPDVLSFSVHRQRLEASNECFSRLCLRLAGVFRDAAAEASEE